MTKDIEREAFEAYELTKNPKCSRETLFKTWQDGDLEGEEKYYVGKYFDSFMQEKWELWVEAKKLEGCVVVPESALKDTFYWPDSEYVVDCPFDYEFDLEKGEIQAIEKWQRTKSTKIYFANIYKDEESFEITEFKSLEEAQDAVKENNAYLDSQEFFNLAEAARGGNELKITK